MSEQEKNNIGANNQLDEKTKKQAIPADEKKSDASVEKASNQTKKAPKRKGDKDAKDEPGQLGDGKDGMAKFKEDLDALVDSEATLSEGFREKAATIFEAAIDSKVAAKVAELDEEYNSKIEEAIEEEKDALVEKIDDYFDYVVESWMDKNELAVEQGLRKEVTENFMNDLRNLFVENYIDVPETKVDMVEELENQVNDLTERLNDVASTNKDLIESVKSMTREKIVAEAAEGLSLKQAERLNSLVENVSFTSEDEFTNKVKTIRESYFKETPSGGAENINEDVAADDTADTIDEGNPMSIYAGALARSAK